MTIFWLILQKQIERPNKLIALLVLGCVAHLGWRRGLPLRESGIIRRHPLVLQVVTQSVRILFPGHRQRSLPRLLLSSSRLQILEADRSPECIRRLPSWGSDPSSCIENHFFLFVKVKRKIKTPFSKRKGSGKDECSPVCGLAEMDKAVLPDGGVCPPWMGQGIAQ